MCIWKYTKWHDTKISRSNRKTTQCRSNWVHNKRSSNCLRIIICCSSLRSCYYSSTCTYNSYRTSNYGCNTCVTTRVTKFSRTIGSRWCQSKWCCTKISRTNRKTTKRRSNGVHNKRSINCLRCINRRRRLRSCYSDSTCFYDCYHVANNRCNCRVTT